MFGRPPGYRTVDDNIVRSYARQLRKRLSEYFAGEGIGHPLRIEIPLGGYLPAFPMLAQLPEAQSKPILVETQTGPAGSCATAQLATLVGRYIAADCL